MAYPETFSRTYPQSYTVTVAGPERHDGEAPYVYCVAADSLGQAKAKVVAHHREERETDDVVVIEDESAPGTPGLCGCRWIDLRDPRLETPEGDYRQQVAIWANRRAELRTYEAAGRPVTPGEWRASNQAAAELLAMLADAYDRADEAAEASERDRAYLESLTFNERLHELANRVNPGTGTEADETSGK